MVEVVGFINVILFILILVLYRKLKKISRETSKLRDDYYKLYADAKSITRTFSDMVDKTIYTKDKLGL